MSYVIQLTFSEKLFIMKTPRIRARVVVSLALLICTAFLSGCAINQRIVPAPVGTTIDTIYIDNNKAVLMTGLLDEIKLQVETLGYGAKVYTGERPKEATYYLTYTANWKWDMAMYLTYFHATLFEEGRVLGTAEYDARMGGANFGKFGHAADKIRPILRELLKNARSSKGSAPAMGSKP